MWWLFQAAYGFLCNSILEFVFFILVDVVAKSPLREARTDVEKRSIWFYESLVLCCLSAAVYVLDHTPYLLILLTLLTFVYTQLCSHMDMQYWWRQIHARWEEHQHHSENVKLVNEQLKHIEMWRKLSMQQNAPAVKLPFRTRLYNFLFRRKTVPDQKPTAVKFAPLSSGGVDTSGNARMAPVGPPATKNTGMSHLNQNQAAAYSHQQQAPPNPIYTATPVSLPAALSTPTLKTTNSWFSKNELKRRPLRAAGYSSPEYSNSSSGALTGQNIRSKFMSAFGLANGTTKPAGIRNDGQNLCFMNCVIQCLSRSPGLVENLQSQRQGDIDCSVAASTMLDSLCSLLTQCSRKRRGPEVLDPTNFRQAVSILNEELLAPLSERQHQQDAAEFFMWLMGTLHNILNKKSTNSADGNKNSRLQMLKFIYGDLTPVRVHELRTACRKEISEANGLRNESYAEPIQRLSDLEWLTYKQNNDSVIDELFSGQLVEAYHCLADNHLTVNTQTFNILPVPVVSPRDVSGLVFLEDCFTKFCNVEHLNGSEGIECEFCNKPNLVQNPETPIYPGQVQKLRNRYKTPIMNSHSPSLSSSVVSPIPGIPSDGGFRTSTPVGEPVQFTAHRLRDAERRCLLRQLPDCLVIQLLRFTYNQFSQQSRKINAPVSIPLKDLDLTSIVYDNVTKREDLTASHTHQKYDLYGVCVHLGAESTSYGHYICYCKAQDGVWYKFDDELVWDVNMEYEITRREIRENAYLLFYKRAEDSGSDT